jgi:hypothetical protein
LKPNPYEAPLIPADQAPTPFMLPLTSFIFAPLGGVSFVCLAHRECTAFIVLRDLLGVWLSEFLRGGSLGLTILFCAASVTVLVVCMMPDIPKEIEADE